MAGYDSTRGEISRYNSGANGGGSETSNNSDDAMMTGTPDRSDLEDEDAEGGGLIIDDK
jgi:hypothetical protein